MASGKFNKVVPGQPLKFSASTYNAMVVAAENFADSAFNHTESRGSGSHLQNNVVLLLNSTAFNLNQSEILGIDKPLILPSQNESEFRRRFSVVGVLPDPILHSEKFVVLAEPIPKGKIGRAWISGVCQVKIDVIDESASTAGVVDQSTIALRTGEGNIPIIWKAQGTGLQWGAVRLGGGSGGGSALAVIRATYAKHLPSGALSPDRMKIGVQEVKIDGEGIARFAGDTMKIVYVWPGLFSENYAAFTWQGNQDPIPKETVIVEVRSIDGRWYVGQWSGLRYRLLPRPLNVRQTDCVAQEARF